MEPKHYIIGDVHGEFDMLMALVAKLPQDARIIFVGDLINRGAKSKEVIDFVRDNAFYCVKGNHEDYFLKFGSLFLKEIENRVEESSLLWNYTNIGSTLRSYGLLDKDSSRVIIDRDAINKMKYDMEWIESLPSYYEFGYIKGYSLPVVVTHAPVDKYWLFKDTHEEYFNFHSRNNRVDPSDSAPIFNIHGHKASDEVIYGSNFVNIDTGCGKGDGKKLTAYCVETKEIFQVNS